MSSTAKRMRVLRNFEQAVTASEVVFIVGSGLSASMSGGALTATWKGLIRSGASRAQRLNSSLQPKWRSIVDDLLEYPDADATISAAGMVAAALRKVGDHAFSEWLSDDVGSLQVQDRSAAEALLSYPFPILTTNYDTLLESVGDRRSVDWTDVRGFHDILLRSSDAVGHLHGLWNSPESLVLSEADYAQFRKHPSIKALEQAVSTLKSIVYIGFGAGLADPNFSALLQWHRAAFPESSVSHFRLCRSSELDELEKIHADEHVVPIVYGTKHSDLALFLKSHLPDRGALVINGAGLARDIVQESRDLLRGSMSSESVLAEAAVGDVGRSDLIVPPVLLPVPHASFVRERMRNGFRNGVEHLDGYSEVQSYDFFVVVGDEGSGLSTAVKWLAIQSSETLVSAAPLFIRFADCRSRRRPLDAAVTTAAMTSGLIHDRRDALPAHVLAIDDFDPTKKRVADMVLTEIAQSLAIVKVIGCRQGNEDEVVSRLHTLGIEPRILFLGRMSKVDIVSLAEKLGPGQGVRLAAETIRILETEGLKRTPLTVSLLLYLLLRGGARDATNLTSIVDAYLMLLLNVGDPLEDETGLTDTDLQAVLSHIAASMISDEKPALLEEEAIHEIAKVLEKYGWHASPSTVLNFLLRRRILLRRGESVEFGRYAYLTLFAARRATVDAEFHDLIVKDLFYYAPVAIRLAALGRTDKDLLAQLGPLLEDELDQVASTGSAYELMPVVAVDTVPSESDDPDGQVDLPDPDLDDELEFPESNYLVSFGLMKSEMSPSARIYRTVLLASSILRDLDQVEDLHLKRELLIMTLELWGRLITVLGTDSSLLDLKDAITRSLVTGREDSAPGDERVWIEFLARSVPAGTVLSGIESTLISPKLSSALNDALARGDLSVTQERRTAALFFLFLMRPKNWALQARSLVETAKPTWILTHFLLALCENAFAHGMTPQQELMDLCRALFVLDQAFATPDIRSAHLDRYSQRLRARRLHTRFAPSSRAANDD